MAIYEFETITAAQALAILPGDEVVTRSYSAPSTYTGEYHDATAQDPATIWVTIEGRTVVFGANVAATSMAGGTRTGWGLVGGGLGTTWVAKEAIDLTGDGYTDVVFHNASTGQIFYVDMTGGALDHWAVVGTVPTSWQVVGSGDYDNDGYGDVLVRDPSNGSLLYANMDAGVFQGWISVLSNPGADWIAA